MRLISIDDLADDALRDLVDAGLRIADGSLDVSSALHRRVVGLYFPKPSTRTRTSFFSAVERMGGGALVLSAAGLQMTTGESLEDTGMAFGLYLDALVARTNGPTEELVALADAAGAIPFVNALSKAEHPTQAVADLITMHQELGSLNDRHVVYLGAWNNTAASLTFAVAKFGAMAVTVCTAPGMGPTEPERERSRAIAARTGSEVIFIEDPDAMPKDVDVLYTTRWQSMGEEPDDPAWRSTLAPYAATEDLMVRHLGPQGIFMHDLPAHRGLEVEASVIDGPCSRIRAQAFNKMTAAMSVLHRLVGEPAA